MSFREIAVTIRAVNRASGEFSKIQSDAGRMTAHLITGFGAAGVAAAQMGAQLGLLSNEQARVVSSAMSVITAIGALAGAHSSGVLAAGVHTAAMFAHKTAQAAATIATWFHNAALIVQVGLLTLGAGVVIAIAAAVWGLAEANRAAAASAREFSAAMEGLAGGGIAGRSIRRAGEEELYRRGVE